MHFVCVQFKVMIMKYFLQWNLFLKSAVKHSLWQKQCGVLPTSWCCSRRRRGCSPVSPRGGGQGHCGAHQWAGLKKWHDNNEVWLQVWWLIRRIKWEIQKIQKKRMSGNSCANNLRMKSLSFWVLSLYQGEIINPFSEWHINLFFNIWYDFSVYSHDENTWIKSPI